MRVLAVSSRAQPTAEQKAAGIFLRKPPLPGRPYVLGLWGKAWSLSKTRAPRARIAGVGRRKAVVVRQHGMSAITHFKTGYRLDWHGLCEEVYWDLTTNTTFFFLLDGF